METYLYDIEYLVKDKDEISKIEKILEELPIEISFHTSMVLELNRFPDKNFPYEMTMYLDRGLERTQLEDYEELEEKYNAGESDIEILEYSNKIDQRLLLREVKPTDKSCKISKTSSEDFVGGVMVVYGKKEDLKKVFLTFWEEAYSDFP